MIFTDSGEGRKKGVKIILKFYRLESGPLHQIMCGVLAQRRAFFAGSLWLRRPEERRRFNSATLHQNYGSPLAQIGRAPEY